MMAFGRLGRTFRRPWAAAIGALGLATVVASTVLAAGAYTSSSVGTDVSWPNCGQSLPTPAAFGIVGATHGRAFTTNSCLGSEVAWAATTTGGATLYMNLNAPVGSTASQGLTGPAGTCARSDKLCLSYAYGWKAAQDAWSYASSQGATSSTWWLDIETGNSWLKSTAANDRTIQGAIDFLGTGTSSYPGKGDAVGIYSTTYQWGVIAGSFHPLTGSAPVPVWYATGTSTSSAASADCSSSYAFTGGSVWLVQYLPGGFDADYGC